jgi:large subunit ribosomal protein L24
VQTTLLGLAITLILALLAALVGPHFVNWNDYRAFFEAEASRRVGLPVRITGKIDAAILPFPSVRLTDLSVGGEGPNGDEQRLRARSLRIEFGLGALLRGEFRAVEMQLIGPTFSLGLDREGQLDWPSLALDADTLSIERLRIEDGRATLSDALSQSRLVLDQLQFDGEMRSFAGPVRGRGFFATGGIGYGYSISTGRYGDDGIRVRLGLETAERPELMEAEGLLTLDRAAPRFEGTVALSRPAGTVLPTGKAVAHEPWKLTAKVKTGAKWAALSEVVFQYGPHEWGTSLVGSARFRFGEQPRIDGELRARQLDLDRMLARADTPRRLPLPAIQALSEMLAGMLRPPWPVALGLHLDAAMLGGAPLQAVRARLQAVGGRWRLDDVEFRAPGATQVKLKGRLEPLSKVLGFAGDVSIDAQDPRTVAAWLAGQPAGGAPVPVKPWRLTGTVTLGGDRLAVDNLRTEFDRGAIEGRLAYFWAAGRRAAKLDAELRAGDLDLDALAGFGDAALAGLGLEWPQEAALALEVDRARIAGIEARNATARLKLDRNGLAIERLSIADFGSAKIDASGRIQTALPQGGNITIDLDARELDGVVVLAEKFAPALVEPLNRFGGQQKAAKLRAAASLTKAADGNTRGTFDLFGRIGAVRVSIAAAATGQPASFLLTDLGALGDTEKSIDGRFESDDGAALLALIGLERIAVGEPHPGRLIVRGHGPRGGELKIEGELSAGPIDAGATGTLRLTREQAARVDFDRFTGSVGGHKVQGRLALSLGETPRLDGALDAETLDLPATIAAAIGLHLTPGTGGEAWSSAPFAAGAPDIAGRIEFRAERASMMASAVARRLRGVARFGPTEIVFDEIAGELAGGRIEGRLAFANGATGLSAQLRAALTGVEAGALFGEGEQPPVTGRVTLQAELAGSGRSPAAFFGSLSGTGNIRLEAAQLARLNPGVFDTVERAAEIGMPTEGPRLQEFVAGVFNRGRLQVPKAEASINVAAGQARLSNVAVQAKEAELEVTANVDLAAATLDALLTLSRLRSPEAAARPALLVALKGALMEPHRAVDAGLLASWLTLRAVEQQSQQIDAMEKANRERPPSTAPASRPPAAPAGDPDTTSSTRSETPIGQPPTRPSPVDMPTAVQPPTRAPRAESAPPLAPSAPARKVVRPPGLVGAQN